MITRSASLLAISLLLLLWAANGLFAQTDHLIQFYQGRVSRDPDDFLPYNQLAAAYIQKARETGEMTYYGLAEKALGRSLELVLDQPAATTALTYLAVVYFAKHQFRDALVCAQKALGLGSGDLSPYAMVGDAYIELGEYDKASLAYAKIRDLRGPLSLHSRLAYLQFLRGDPQGALQHMRKAVAAATAANVPNENIAWSQVQLGEEFFSMGDLTQADKFYRDALVRYPEYHPALAGLAKVRSAQQKYQEAIELYQKALAIIPLPDYAAALGDVYTKIGYPNEAKKQYDLVEYMGYLNAMNQTIYNRELALFYADHDLKLKASLELAERELEVRRDIYTYDVLAWALYKNEKPQEARAAMREALKLGTKDARLLFHAGMIHHRLGERDKTREYLHQALSLNPHFHIFYADVAERTLTELKSQSGSTAVQEKGDGY